MRTPLALLLGLLLSGVSALAQTSPAPAPEAGAVAAETLVAKSLAAFSTAPVRQVQLTGSAKAYAGSSQPEGTFSAALQSTGESTLQLNLAELSRTETTGAFSPVPQCLWAGADGVQHDAAQHNCFLPVHWLVPVLALQTQAMKLNHTASTAMDKDVAVQELSMSSPPGNGSAPAQKVAQLSTAKLSLDPATFEPTSLRFNLHPDKDANTDIPIVVRYSDYREVSGTSIPFHIQKYLNNGLVLDLQVEAAEVR